MEPHTWISTSENGQYSVTKCWKESSSKRPTGVAGREFDLRPSVRELDIVGEREGILGDVAAL